MVSKSIPEPNVRVCLDPQGMFVYSVWSRNPMGHNEDVVSAWEVFVNIPHRIMEKISDTI